MELPEVSDSHRLPLCILSQAVGGAYESLEGGWNGYSFHHQAGCPMDLSRSLARSCPCRNRVPAGLVRDKQKQIVTIQVLACTFPMTWKGDTIRNPTAYAAAMRRTVSNN